MFQREYVKIITLYVITKTLQNSSLNACVLHTFMFYKCSVWPPPTATTTLSRYENLSQTRHSMPRYTVLISAVIQSFMSSVFAGSCETQTTLLTYFHKKKLYTGRSGNVADQAQRAKYSPTNPLIAEAPMNEMENSAMDRIKRSQTCFSNGWIGKRGAKDLALCP